MGPGHGQSNATTLQFQKLEDKLHRLEKEKNDISQVCFYFVYISIVRPAIIICYVQDKISQPH
jgi:hypothetical protein